MPPHKEATGPWENRPAEKPGLEFVTQIRSRSSFGWSERERASVKASKSLNRNPRDKGKKKTRPIPYLAHVFFIVTIPGPFLASESGY